MAGRLRNFARSIKREIDVYRRVLRHPRTPPAAKVLLGLALGYLLLPFDLIPDFIPVLGQLDDLLIVPGLIWLAVKLVPPDVIDDCRAAAGLEPKAGAARGKADVKRYLLLGLFALVLVSPFLLRLVFAKTDAPAVAVDASAPRLVIVTPHNQDIRREFERAFSAWHEKKYGTPVDIDYRTPGGTNDIERLLQNTYALAQKPDGTLPPPADVTADLDMVWGGGDYVFDQHLKKLLTDNSGKPVSVLEPVELPPGVLEAAYPDPTLAGIRLYDYDKTKPISEQRPQWVGVCLSSFGIVYNPDIYKAMMLPAPKTWRDLTQPELAGKVALADPTHSGSAAVAYEMVLQRAMADAEEAFFEQHPDKPKNAAYQAALAAGWQRGMSDLIRIAANARYFTDSASQVPNDVANGDAAAGMAIDFYGRVNEELLGSGRITFVSPKAATAISPDPIAVLYGVKGRKKELATHFMEFLLSKPGQVLWNKRPGTPGGPLDRALRRPPIRQDVYADTADFADPQNPFKDAGGFNQRGEWMKTFGPTQQIWAAAWIDAREALKSAYGKVLAEKDVASRDALLSDLAAMPDGMSLQYLTDLYDAAKLQKKVGPNPPAGDPDTAKLAALLKKVGVPPTTDLNGERWKATWRIDWAEKFREHYAAVAGKVGA